MPANDRMYLERAPWQAEGEGCDIRDYVAGVGVPFRRECRGVEEEEGRRTTGQLDRGSQREGADSESEEPDRSVDRSG